MASNESAVDVAIGDHRARPGAPINLAAKLASFAEQWRPKVVADLNDYEIKVVRIAGDFVWHRHDDTDELFLVVDGAMSIDFRDGRVDLAAGELFVVPKGVEHKPFADRECSVLLIEPKGVVNTGDAAPGTMTAPDRVVV